MIFPTSLEDLSPVSFCSQHCDLYVARLLPQGRQFQGSTERDPARFGLSQPCIRCLRVLQHVGVQRVIFTTGEQTTDGIIGCEVCDVEDLLESAQITGHCSRGDEGAVACGAVRGHEVTRRQAPCSGRK